MNFELNEDQRIFYDTVKKFALKELAEGALERANFDVYPWDVAEKFSQMGLLGITVPEKRAVLAAP